MKEEQGFPPPLPECGAGPADLAASEAQRKSEGSALIEGLPLRLDEERGMSLWLDPEYAPNQPNVAIARDLLRRLCRAIQAGNTEAEEAHQLGKSDGYEEAVQDIDRLTGGDGEYVFSTIPGEGCPDPAAMKARIVARFADLSKAEGRS